MDQDLFTTREMPPLLTAGRGRHLLGLPEFCHAQPRAIRGCYAPSDPIAREANPRVVGIAPGMAVFLGRKDPVLASRQTDRALLPAAFDRLKGQVTTITGAVA